MDRVLFWDFHGTLCIPESLWSVHIWKAATDVLPGCGLTLSEVSAKLCNDGFPWRHPERDMLGYRDPERWWEYVGRLFTVTLLRCGLSEADAAKVVPRVRPRILAHENFHLYPDAEPTLRALSARGWKHFILSNNFPELEELCRGLGIHGFFEGFVVSALVGYDKPRREIFERALERAGRPQTCFMVGDNPVADVWGAKNAGVGSILVHGSAVCGADFTCENLTDILKAL